MSEFSRSERIVSATLAISLLWLIDPSNSTEDDVNHYIQNAPSPHSQNASIPEDKVLPPDAGNVQFRDGAAEYHAPPEVAEKTGLYGVTAFCGNPIDKLDPHNLYASMTVRKEDGPVEVMAGIATAVACEDGLINDADRPEL